MIFEACGGENVGVSRNRDVELLIFTGSTKSTKAAAGSALNFGLGRIIRKVENSATVSSHFFDSRRQ